MDSISPAWLLLGVLICSMIGRFMIIRAAWEISKPWGVAVFCVPFAPMVFRMKYKELAGEGQNWRTATTIFGVAFFAVTGSTGSLDDLWQIVPEKLRPARYAEHTQPEEPDTDAPASTPEEPEERDEETTPEMTPVSKVAVAQATPAPAAAMPSLLGRLAGIIHARAATPAPSSVAPTAPPVPAGPTLAQQVAANQAEFARLGEVYETLKKEKGYLKKWDQEQIKAYNAEAAKYQAALAAARATQVELNKQASLARK